MAWQVAVCGLLVASAYASCNDNGCATDEDGNTLLQTKARVQQTKAVKKTTQLEASASPAWDTSNCPMYTGTGNCWATTAFQYCPYDRDAAYFAVMKAGACIKTTPTQCQGQYKIYKELVDGKFGCTEAPPWAISQCPMYNGTGNCWATTAFQYCPYDRDAAYFAVMSAGACIKTTPIQCQGQYKIYKELVDGKINCTEAPPWAISQCPMYTGTGNCWATTAFQYCPYDRDAAYFAVMSAGACIKTTPIQCQWQYKIYKELVDGKINCTVAPNKLD